MMIVQKAVELARVADTVLVGDDTDILVLLCYHACLESHNIIFQTRTKESHYEIGLSDTAILVSRSILKPLFAILNTSRYLQICQS